METVVQPPVDAELNLLTEWGDASARKRTRKAAILSVAAHVVVILTLPWWPQGEPRRPREATEIRRVTPLIEPLTELTQRDPNKGKLAKEFNAAEVQPRPRIQIPAGSPSTTRPRALRPAEIPSMPAPKAAAPAPLPDAPAVEAPKAELPKMTLPTLPPQIQAVEQRPKNPFETPGGPPSPVAPSQRQIPIPDTSVAGAVRQSIRGGGGGGLMVGDPDAAGGPGGVGSGINLPPSPGAQASNMQLLSDPMGVDFRPYLTQILAIVRRNWFSVMPESVKLGQRGRVGVLFGIAKNGTVTRANYASQSGMKALDQAAIAAISMSNPFPPLPSEFKGERIVLQFNFAYNMR
jgi:TonB family protein